MTIIITGANGALGLELAKCFLNLGNKVVGLDYQTNQLEKLQEDFSQLLIIKKIDLSHRTKREQIFKEILSDYHDFTLWINNAGIVAMEFLHETSIETMDRVMEINYKAYQDFTLWSYQHFYNNTKTYEKFDNFYGIINVASAAGHLSLGGISSYVASKHAVVGLTESLQQEIQSQEETRVRNPSKLKVMLVSPGFFDSPLMKPNQGRRFPEKFNFLSSSAYEQAQIIFSSWHNGQEFVSPGLAAKSLLFAQRISPLIVKKMGIKLIKEVREKS
jgi:short-subunit dehydrogenase